MTGISILPMRMMRSPPWWMSRRARSWRRSMSASSRKAWPCRPMVRSPSPPPKPPTWRIGSTRRPTPSSPIRWFDARPRHAEFADSGKELWVSSEIGGTISIFDVATQAEKGKIAFAIQGVTDDLVQPVGFAFTDDGKTAFVALGPANHVAVVNAQTREVEKYILVGRRVWHMAFSPIAPSCSPPMVSRVTSRLSMSPAASRSRPSRLAAIPGAQRCARPNPDGGKHANLFAAAVIATLASAPVLATDDDDGKAAAPLAGVLAKATATSCPRSRSPQARHSRTRR